MEPQQSGGAAGGETRPEGQEAKTQAGLNPEIGTRIPRRAFERLMIHQIRTGKTRSRILEELIMSNLPNYVIQIRANAANPSDPTGNTDGPVNPTGESLPMGETLTSSPAKKPSRRAG